MADPQQDVNDQMFWKSNEGDVWIELLSHNMLSFIDEQSKGSARIISIFYFMSVNYRTSHPI